MKKNNKKSTVTKAKSQPDQMSDANVPTTETMPTTTEETTPTPMMAEVAPAENHETTPTVANNNEIVQAPGNDEPTGTEIALSGDWEIVLDALVKVPADPAHEWQGPAEPPLVLPDEAASNEELIGGARQLVQTVRWRLRRTVQEWWLVGRHLTILKSRPENEGRWRTEILPQIGINHTTDHQLRTMAERIGFEACLQYSNKSEVFREIGLLPAKKAKQLCGSQTDAVGSNGAKVQNGIEDILGIESEMTFDFGSEGPLGQAVPFDFGSDGPLSQAAPFDEIDVQSGEVAEPNAVEFAEEATQTEAKADAKAQPNITKVTPKVAPQPTKIAAKVVPETKPKGDDPIDGTEALIVVLEGAKAADKESLVAQSGFTVLSKSQDRVVGGLWYGRESNKAARAIVHEALAKLRAGKGKIKIEANYLELSDVIAV